MQINTEAIEEARDVLDQLIAEGPYVQHDDSTLQYVWSMCHWCETEPHEDHEPNCLWLQLVWVRNGLTG